MWYKIKADLHIHSIHSDGTYTKDQLVELAVKKDVDIKEIGKRIKNAGYEYVMNALEAHFSQDKIQEDGNNSAASDAAKPTKAGDHTLVASKATIAFKPLIPFIAAGAKAKLKGGKDKDIAKKDKDKKEITDSEEKERED